MGITNRFFKTENAPNGDDAKLAKWDKVADPEDEVDANGRGDIDVVADFMRLLGAPPQKPASLAAFAGANVFRQIGCDGCHTKRCRVWIRRTRELNAVSSIWRTGSQSPPGNPMRCWLGRRISRQSLGSSAFPGRARERENQPAGNKGVRTQ